MPADFFRCLTRNILPRVRRNTAVIGHLSCLGIVLLALMSCVHAADEPSLQFENDQLRVRFMPRTPDQMAGFFEARGFPKSMREQLAGYCFFTVTIKNKSQDVVWLDLTHWRFVTAAGEVKRIQRQFWAPLWQQLAIPMASQSTFRWTLLPETLDFRPEEHEGGNVVLQDTSQEFVLQAEFAMGENRDQGVIKASIEHLRCARDARP